jgi:hypothetical protein
MMGVLSRASLGAGGPAGPVAPLPGFIESAFNPFAYAVGKACLSAVTIDGARTGVILGSVLGDTTTTDRHCQRLAAGQRHNPLLFMQATPNAVLGALTAEFAVTGPILSVSAPGDPAAELIEVARSLLADGLGAVLVIAVELATTERGIAARGPGPAHDRAAAVLLGPGGEDVPAGPLSDLIRLSRNPDRVPPEGDQRC